MIEKNPDLVKRVALGVARAWVAADRDRNGAIAAVAKRDRLLRPETEVAAHELGDRPPDQDTRDQAERARLHRRGPAGAGIEGAGRGFKLPKPVSVGEIYDGRFLPPAADRKFA